MKNTLPSSSTTSLNSSWSSSSNDLVKAQDSALVTLHRSEEDSDDDAWVGVAKEPTRGIMGTPFFLSRRSYAIEPEGHDKRLNAHGYDMDDPMDALVKYEEKHPEPLKRKIWHAFTDSLFNLFTVGIPALLSASAGDKKQRIDQKVILRVVREAVDKFPELKIRMDKNYFDRLDVKDQRRWHENMAVIRAAQHDYIANELAKVYPNHIEVDAPTLLYTGGRATGLLRVLYCSLDEYVALYWSDWGLLSTDSGSYRAHVYDYITEGHNVNWNAEYLDYKPHDFEVTEPGEYTFLGKGDRKIWSFEGPCGMVDHGLGDIPSMLKFATVTNVTTTLNIESIGRLLSTQFKAVAHEYGQRFKETFNISTDVEVKPMSRVAQGELIKAQQFFSKILVQARLA